MPGASSRAGMIDRVAKAVREHALQERVVVTCFVPQILRRRSARLARGARARLARPSLGRDDGRPRGRARHLRRASTAASSPSRRSCSRRSWAYCADRLGGERLGVWVVNEADDIERWAEAPLRQITTRPARPPARAARRPGALNAARRTRLSALTRHRRRRDQRRDLLRRLHRRRLDRGASGSRRPRAPAARRAGRARCRRPGARRRWRAAGA